MENEKVKKVIKIAIKISTFGVALVGTPVIYLLWLPCKLYKTGVFSVAKIIRRDLGPMLGTLDTILASSNSSTNLSSCSIVTVLRVDGNLGLEHVQQIFQENVISCPSANGKYLKYYKLKMYPVKFLGYWFWKRDTHFSLQNHITEYEHISMLPISKIHQILLNLKFPPEKSPWQLVIFRNAQQNRTFLAFRVHHSMADGRSVVKLLVECLGEKVLVAKEAQFENPQPAEKLKYAILKSINMTKLVSKLIRYRIKINEHPWKREIIPHDDSSLLCVGITGRLFLAKLKDVSRVKNVHVSAVFISVITSAIQKFMETEGRNVGTTLPIYITLPRPDHPDKMKNHLCIALPEVIYKNDNDELEQLQQCNKIYKRLRKSGSSRHLASLLKIVSEIPGGLGPKLSNFPVVTSGLSNIAGEQEGFSVGECSCIGFTMSAGLFPGSIGVNFTVISYKESVQVSVVAKASVLTEKQVVALARLVEKKFVALGQLVLG